MHTYVRRRKEAAQEGVFGIHATSSIRAAESGPPLQDTGGDGWSVRGRSGPDGDVYDRCRPCRGRQNPAARGRHQPLTSWAAAGAIFAPAGWGMAGHAPTRWHRGVLVAGASNRATKISGLLTSDRTKLVCGDHGGLGPGPRSTEDVKGECCGLFRLHEVMMAQNR